MSILSTNNGIITRFPPSPTGFLHIGGIRTALFNYLFAKKNGGKFLFRLEDTDRERSKPEFAENILDGLKWVGLEFDNKEIIRQSERTEIYKKYLQKLLAGGFAYLSQEQIEKEGDRAEVIRFKNPNKKIKFSDLVRGEVEFDTSDLKDFVIAKSISEPIYHLAAVVDDFEMAVTHIIRGEEHISNTPRQILIQEALGFPRPEYAHIPLILAPDRSKLSKRHGAVSVTEYRDQGFLPEAVINYLALLGWNPGTDQEIFSLPELVKEFDMSKVQKGGAIFNIEKLKWFNKHHLQQLGNSEKLELLKKYLTEPQLQVVNANPKLVEVMMERVATFGELRDLINTGEYDYFFGEPKYEKNVLLWKGAGDLAKTKERLLGAKKLIEGISDNSFNRLAIKEILWPYAEKEGRGEVLWPLRVCLSGKEKSPDPFVLSEMLGKEITLKRITNALNLIS